MLEHLPPGNAIAREFNGPWGDDQVLLHAVANGLMRLNANYYNVHRQKGDQPESPDYIKNPNDEFRGEGSAELDEAQKEQIRTEQQHLRLVLTKNKHKQR